MVCVLCGRVIEKGNLIQLGNFRYCFFQDEMFGLFGRVSLDQEWGQGYGYGRQWKRVGRVYDQEGKVVRKCVWVDVDGLQDVVNGIRYGWESKQELCEGFLV